ncbi:hypothetical protein KIW84_058305 [Lathyrus oleraceus]|uniref:Uncharacterized protein n=1 Tax=Pisum sativum TaxID=3888 RepID=A0A9D5AQ26_PEA|nr:hypothetical protein KIW84_058305 [Pisum sativum]
MRVKTVMQDDIYATLAKFEAYSKELATKTLIQQNARNYSEPEPYIYTNYSLKEDSSYQLEETLIECIKMTQLNFEKLNRHQETVLSNMETSFENLEIQLGQISIQLALKLRSSGNFYENILDSPRDAEFERAVKQECEEMGPKRSNSSRASSSIRRG